MFNIEADPIFTETVKVTPPGHEPQSFAATFRAMPISVLNAVDFTSSEETRAFLDQVLVSADEIVGNDGRRMEWTGTLKAQLLDLSWARSGLFAAYLEGVGSATRKN